MLKLEVKRPFLIVSLPSLAALVGVALLAGSVQAQPNVSSRSAPDAAQDGYASLVPETGSPPNGGTTTTGQRITLDLKVNAGSNSAPDGVTAAQEYLLFNSSVLQVVAPNASCSAVPPQTTTITPDNGTLESVLQNEVCNGPAGCIIRSVPIQPGSIGYASGALTGCPQGCGGEFRVATITLCAVGGGQGDVSFQFSPPAPSVRDSEIVILTGVLIQDRSRYRSYTVTVNGVTATPGPPTWTPGTVPTPPGGTCAMNFSDVPSSNEFYQYIQQLYCRDTNPRIITGFADGTFRPYDNTKRSQLAKMIVLAFRVRINTSGGPHFTDVPPSLGETYNYVETAFNSQIITGYANHLFKPWDLVKRGQVAKMVVRAANIPINTTGGPHFIDVPVGNEFYQYIETALNRNIITGFADHTFRPYNYATRGQISKIVAGAAPQ